MRALGYSERVQALQYVGERCGLVGNTQQLDRARDGQGRDGLNDTPVEIDPHHLMGIVDFSERHRQGAAGIAHMLLAADPLSAMQMAQGGIADLGGEDVRRQGLGSADDDPPLGVGRGLSAHQVAMTESDDGLTAGAAMQRSFERTPIQLPDPLRVGIAIGLHPRYVAGAEKGHRQTPGDDFAFSIAQGHDQPVGVDGAVGRVADGADYGDIERLQQRGGGFQPSGRVVVAGDDDDGEVWRAALGLGQEIVELLLRLGRRIGIVEDVAGDQQGIDLFAFQGVEQPVQKTTVLVTAIEIMQSLAEMPVRGM